MAVPGPVPLTPGTRLDPYEVGPRIGVGSISEVYRATDTNLARPVEEYLQGLTMTGTNADQMAALRRAFGANGMPGYLREWIEQLKRDDVSRSRYTSMFVAGASARLGERDRAFEWLERASAERSPQLVHVRELLEFDNLRSDPRFNDLLQRFGLPPV